MLSTCGTNRLRLPLLEPRQSEAIFIKHGLMWKNLYTFRQSIEIIKGSNRWNLLASSCQKLNEIQASFAVLTGKKITNLRLRYFNHFTAFVLCYMYSLCV